MSCPSSLQAVPTESRSRLSRCPEGPGDHPVFWAVHTSYFAPPTGQRRVSVAFSSSLAWLFAKMPVQHVLRKFRTLVFQDLCALFDTAVERHADLPLPCKDVGVLNRCFVH